MAVHINRKRLLRRFNSDISHRLSRKQVHDVKGCKEFFRCMNNQTLTIWLAREKLCHLSEGSHNSIKNTDDHQDILCDRNKCEGGLHADQGMQTSYMTNFVQKLSKFDTKRGEVYEEKKKFAFSNGKLFAPTLIPPPKTAESCVSGLESHCVDTESRSSASLSYGQNAKLYTVQENRVGKQSDRSFEAKTSIKSSTLTNCSHSFHTSKPSAEGEIRKLADTHFRKCTYRQKSTEGRSPDIWMNVTDSAVKNYLCSIQRRSPNAYVLELLKHRLDPNSVGHVTTITRDAGSINCVKECGLAETNIFQNIQ